MMEYYVEYEVTEEDLLVLKQKKHFGERLNFIREKADMCNDGEFTINKFASKVGTAQSTISRIEAGELQDPKGSLLIKIAKALSVPMEVFYSEYYHEDLTSFVICGYKKLTFDVDMLEPIYRVDFKMTAYTRDGLAFQEIEKSIGVSILELEETFDEGHSLLNKVDKRRKLWEKKKLAYLQLRQMSGTEKS